MPKLKNITALLAASLIASTAPQLLAQDEKTEGTSSAAEISPENPAQDLQDEEEVTENPVEDTSQVEKVRQESSYSNPELDQRVAKALSDQGYFSAASGTSKENFVAALKNFQTLNGMEPTGEITPEVLGKLGIGTDQFSPE